MIVDRRISKLIALLLPVCCHCYANVIREDRRTDAETEAERTQRLSENMQMSAAIGADGMIQESSPAKRTAKKTACCYTGPDIDSRDEYGSPHELHDRYGRLPEGKYGHCGCWPGPAPQSSYPTAQFVDYIKGCNPCAKNIWSGDRKMRPLLFDLKSQLKMKAQQMRTQELARGLADFLVETIPQDDLWKLARNLNLKEGFSPGTAESQEARFRLAHW